MDAQEQQKELIRRNAELAKVLSLSLSLSFSVCYTMYTFTCKLGCRFYRHKAMALLSMASVYYLGSFEIVFFVIVLSLKLLICWCFLHTTNLLSLRLQF
jgi:hypothetical protein